MNMKKLIASLCIAFACIGLLGVCLGVNSIGPWPITGTLPVTQTLFSPAGSNSFTCTGTSTLIYLSSGGSAATSLPCKTVTISATTAAATLYSSSGTAGVNLPTGSLLTLSASDVNTLKVSGGTTAVVGFLYTN